MPRKYSIMFSKTCEYGLRAVIYIAHQSESNLRVGVTSIAENIGSPKAFTAKILQQLTRGGIVNSVKGPNGGFEIDNSSLDKVRLGDIIRLLDGDGIFKGCALGLDECDPQHPCPVHDQFAKIRNDLKKMLNETTLAVLVNRKDMDLSWLRRK